ncbi:PREDICTED: uncharacterized protein LOC106748153 [Dinoponera quadriceps]|uniref:Uncharacterized protein LOC106748153 n=1 Tax=Dinoponera quadriceps TaxID=609295 RepID=A0A6P3XV23_DINQU|nr:PREDICTED: uncharacterized protein LOC106748153 [Dinoponera quadriceps]
MIVITCPVCIRERTMKVPAGTILVACFAIAALEDPAAGLEVSSKVDLDSDENRDTLSNTASDAYEDPSESEYTSVSRAFIKQPAAAWRREGELVKPAREQRKRRIYAERDDPSSQPKVINNIRIVVNGNDSLPSVSSCKHGVCNVSVSSKPDGKGNIVTEVRLSIVTRAKPDVRINEVPVVVGFRGANKESNERPIFYPTNAPNLPHLHLHRDYIPQIQSNYQGYGEPWYQHRRNFQRPPTYRGYQNFGDRGDGFRGRDIWSRGRATMDDKIEPPLSKTKSSNDTDS